MATFKPSRSLLNPQFEGYKLALITQDEAVSRYRLPYKATQSTTSGKIPLSFQEMQSRITHNHISIENETCRAIYVDSEYRVILVEFQAQTPSFRVVHEMPTPLQSATTVHREYSAAMFVGPTLVVASDGNGSLYVLSIKNQGLSEPIGTYYLAVEGQNVPFRIHYVHRISPTTAVLIISSKVQSERPSSEARGNQSHSIFDVRAIKINLLSLRPENAPCPMDILWNRRGEDVPISGSYLQQFDSYTLIGGATYTDPNATFPFPYEPTPDEIAPIPRPNDIAGESDESTNPPPYSWTQTTDSLTIAIPLPAAISKNDIHVSFSVKTLTVHVDYNALTSISIPQYSGKTLWDNISPSSSFWTWDREAEHSYGLLTLHLEKQHEGTRWMQVFASAAVASSAANFADVDVPETLDPSELWRIREALEKHTAALRDGGDASGLGLGSGVPSLASGEMDEEVDVTVGRKAYLTWVASDGSVPAWCKPTEQVPFQLLASVLPGLSDSEPCLVIRNNLDGVVFSLDPSKMDQPSWLHTSTYPAIAFVLASKRDTRFSHLVPSRAILAFESGGLNRGGNVYIYRPAGVKDKWAKQSVLKVDDGQGGALLGVGALSNSSGELIVICLLEEELVLIKGI